MVVMGMNIKQALVVIVSVCAISVELCLIFSRKYDRYPCKITAICGLVHVSAKLPEKIRVGFEINHKINTQGRYGTADNEQFLFKLCIIRALTENLLLLQ